MRSHTRHRLDCGLGCYWVVRRCSSCERMRYRESHQLAIGRRTWGTNMMRLFRSSVVLRTAREEQSMWSYTLTVARLWPYLSHGFPLLPFLRRPTYVMRLFALVLANTTRRAVDGCRTQPRLDRGLGCMIRPFHALLVNAHTVVILRFSLRTQGPAHAPVCLCTRHEKSKKCGLQVVLGCVAVAFLALLV